MGIAGSTTVVGQDRLCVLAHSGQIPQPILSAKWIDMSDVLREIAIWKSILWRHPHTPRSPAGHPAPGRYSYRNRLARRTNRADLAGRESHLRAMEGALHDSPSCQRQFLPKRPREGLLRYGLNWLSNSLDPGTSALFLSRTAEGTLWHRIAAHAAPEPLQLDSPKLRMLPCSPAEVEVLIEATKADAYLQYQYGVNGLRFLHRAGS
ncbi:hypothetical protein AB0904_01295 [Streptomyces sp. NPDC006684]|uniref:hypothetical protein n=1 Tax=Streptomyces sp. NPDC006684 TaxID=3154477 RepID=UPI0034533BD2